MNVGIHQPDYIPWLGLFYKMYLSDVFVHLDDEPRSCSFTAARFTNDSISAAFFYCKGNIIYRVNFNIALAEGEYSIDYGETKAEY